MGVEVRVGLRRCWVTTSIPVRWPGSARPGRARPRDRRPPAPRRMALRDHRPGGAAAVRRDHPPPPVGSVVHRAGGRDRRTPHPRREPARAGDRDGRQPGAHRRGLGHRGRRHHPPLHRPQSARPQSARPQSADRNQPDRNQPDRNQPDRNQPDRNQRDRDKPDKPDGARRDQHRPELDAHPDERLPRSALRRHVQIRDRTCVGPGCRRRSRRCDQDHTVAYQAGGTLLRLIWDRCAATTTCSRPTAAGHCSSLSLAGSCGPPRSRPATRFGPNPSSRRYRSRARRRRIPRTTNRHLPPRRPSRSGHPHRSHPGRHRRNPRRLTPTSSRRSEQRATPPHDRPNLRHVPSIGVASVGRVDGGCGGRPPPGIRRRYRMKALVYHEPGRKAQGLAVVR